MKEHDKLAGKSELDDRVKGQIEAIIKAKTWYCEACPFDSTGVCEDCKAYIFDD